MCLLMAGAGKALIDYPEDIFPFREGKDTWTGIHDVPCVRVLIIDANIRFAYVSVEAVVLDGETTGKIREAVSEAGGIPSENIWISSTHTVSTPHFFPVEHKTGEENPLGILMNEHFVRAAAEAARIAEKRVKPVRAGYAQGYCTVNTNRMIPTNEGWWIGNGEEFPSDHSVPVIRLDGEDGIPVAIIYNYACELSVMDNSIMRDGGRHVTADLAGAASSFVEAEYGNDLVAVFMPGPSADQGPVYRSLRIERRKNGGYNQTDLQDDGWLLLEQAGKRLAEQIIVATENAECSINTLSAEAYCKTYRLPGQQLRGLPNPLHAPIKEWKSAPAEDRTRSVEIMILNDTVIISAGGLSAATAMHIKETSPFLRTIITESVSGRAKRLPTDGAKGLADAISYERGTVHAKNSEFGKGAAEILVSSLIDFLKELKSIPNSSEDADQ